MSEALIFSSTNPQYDNRLFIELPVQYMKIPSSEHVVYINCSECQNKNKKQFVYTTCSELGIFMYWTRNSMNNLLSYYGLVDARISPSDKDLPAQVDDSHQCTVVKISNTLFIILSITIIDISSRNILVVDLSVVLRSNWASTYVLDTFSDFLIA